MKIKRLAMLVVVAVMVFSVVGGASAQGDVKKATKGLELDLVLLPKFLGILPFDEANQGAQEAHKELENKGVLEFLGPTPENSIPGQIEIIKAATTRGVDGIMISANSYDQLSPATKEALEKGIKVVTWDSPIEPSAEILFISQVDFGTIGQVMADMALSIMGEEGGEFAFLSATPDASNQNAWMEATKKALEDPKYAKVKLVDTVYGNDTSEDSYEAALGLIDKHPNLKVIMAPTSVGAPAAAKALQDEGLCEKVKVSGLALPSEMYSYTKNGCAPEFALWSFVDLGYLAYYTTYMIAAGDIEGKVGETFEAGRMGTYTIEEDPGREGGVRVLMGPFTVYNAENIDAAVPEDQRPKN
ncbi:MAG: hypothetical protein OHK0023_01530 [Anaerolineae bacterium]